MARQLNLPLHPGALRFDAGFAIDWRALDRRAARIAADLAKESADALRRGMELRSYAADLSLLEILRRRRSGKHLRRPAGISRRVPRSVLAALTPGGSRLHRLAAQLESRVAAREAVTLCG